MTKRTILIIGILIVIISLIAVTLFLNKNKFFNLERSYPNKTHFNDTAKFPKETLAPSKFCEKDSDCVIRDKPSCCGEKIEYTKECVTKDFEFQEPDCKGIASCPIFKEPKDCECVNNKCEGIYKENSLQKTDSSFKKCESGFYWGCKSVTRGAETTTKSPQVCGCIPKECPEGQNLIVSATQKTWPDGSAKGIFKCSEFLPP